MCFLHTAAILLYDDWLLKLDKNIWLLQQIRYRPVEKQLLF